LQLTVKTRIKAESTFPFLEEMAAEYSTVKRKLFTQIIKRKKNRTELKREFCAQFEITARQFNSIWCEITACISSVYELKLVKIKNLENRIENLEERITKANSSFKIHHFKRKASTLQSSLNKLQKLKSFPSICFGSKKLFKKQFFLEKNGYQSHEEWREEWKAARNSQFFLVGSKDESFGNQSCQMLPGRLQLRLTNKMAKRLGSKTISIPCEFSYSQEVIHAALISGQAMSYRFAKEGSRWYVSLSTEAPSTKLVTDFTQGALGIDLNPSCIALAHISNDGNLVHSWQVPILIQGKSQSQIKATLGQEIAKIVDYAVDHNLPMIIENLDFSKKKTELRSRRMNRMLSHFAYSQFEKMISSRCHKNGVQLRRVNPAYTSVIGLFKFSIGHGLSSHCAAAMTIARRGFPRKLTFSAKNKKKNI
jgi:IS605 OrfB family transposase